MVPLHTAYRTHYAVGLHHTAPLPRFGYRLPTGWFILPYLHRVLPRLLPQRFVVRLRLRVPVFHYTRSYRLPAHTRILPLHCGLLPAVHTFCYRTTHAFWFAYLFGCSVTGSRSAFGLLRFAFTLPAWLRACVTHVPHTRSTAAVLFIYALFGLRLHTAPPTAGLVWFPVTVLVTTVLATRTPRYTRAVGLPFTWLLHGYRSGSVLVGYARTYTVLPHAHGCRSTTVAGWFLYLPCLLPLRLPGSLTGCFHCLPVLHMVPIHCGSFPVAFGLHGYRFTAVTYAFNAHATFTTTCPHAHIYAFAACLWFICSTLCLVPAFTLRHTVPTRFLHTRCTPHVGYYVVRYGFAYRFAPHVLPHTALRWFTRVCCLDFGLLVLPLLVTLPPRVVAAVLRTVTTYHLYSLRTLPRCGYGSFAAVGLVLRLDCLYARFATVHAVTGLRITTTVYLPAVVYCLRLRGWLFSLPLRYAHLVTLILVARFCRFAVGYSYSSVAGSVTFTVTHTPFSHLRFTHVLWLPRLRTPYAVTAGCRYIPRSRAAGCYRACRSSVRWFCYHNLYLVTVAADYVCGYTHFVRTRFLLVGYRVCCLPHTVAVTVTLPLVAFNTATRVRVTVTHAFTRVCTVAAVTCVTARGSTRCVRWFALPADLPLLPCVCCYACTLRYHTFTAPHHGSCTLCVRLFAVVAVIPYHCGCRYGSLPTHRSVLRLVRVTAYHAPVLVLPACRYGYHVAGWFYHYATAVTAFLPRLRSPPFGLVTVPVYGLPHTTVVLWFVAAFATHTPAATVPVMPTVTGFLQFVGLLPHGSTPLLLDTVGFLRCTHRTAGYARSPYSCRVYAAVWFCRGRARVAHAFAFAALHTHCRFAVAAHAAVTHTRAVRTYGCIYAPPAGSVAWHATLRFVYRFCTGLRFFTTALPRRRATTCTDADPACYVHFAAGGFACSYTAAWLVLPYTHIHRCSATACTLPVTAFTQLFLLHIYLVPAFFGWFGYVGFLRYCTTFTRCLYVCRLHRAAHTRLVWFYGYSFTFCRVAVRFWFTRVTTLVVPGWVYSSPPPHTVTVLPVACPVGLHTWLVHTLPAVAVLTDTHTGYTHSYLPFLPTLPVTVAVYLRFGCLTRAPLHGARVYLWFRSHCHTFCRLRTFCLVTFRCRLVA